MPPRIPRACRKSGCNNTTTERNGYCQQHKNLGWENHQQGKSRHERGYGSKWDNLRKIVLEHDKYLCQDCLRRGVARTAKTVDHIIAKAHGGTDEPKNLQSLCWPCHKAKTAKERII